MLSLLIIADDQTGSLDTGVQLAQMGLKVQISNNCDISFRMLPVETEVLVINTESRPMKPDEAYRTVCGIVKRARKNGVKFIMKKTDSALRGNIGAELKALLDGSGEKALPFLPAYPAMNRVTRDGIHYINSVPVKDSSFGKDPFEPVKHSAVDEIIHDQSDVSVVYDEIAENLEQQITVYNITSQQQLRETTEKLCKNSRLSIMAGCAGLASVLQPVLFPQAGKCRKQQIPANKNFLVACGSVNEASVKQVQKATEEGFYHFSLTPEQKLKPDYWESDEGRQQTGEIMKYIKEYPRFILDTNDKENPDKTRKLAEQEGISSDILRKRIPLSLNSLVKKIIENGYDGVFMLIGGDTLAAFLKVMEINEITPLYEVAPGTVAATFFRNGKTGYIITKSGGFGEEDLLIRLADRLDKTDEVR